MKYIFFLLLTWNAYHHAHAQQETTKIYLLRHAEKDTTIKQDPSLTKEGVERSERLSNLLKEVPVDKLFSTNARRTKQTLLPLSISKGLAIDFYDSKDSMSMEKLYSLIKYKTTVIAGHSNTIPDLVNTLIGQEVYPEMDESEFGKIWVLTFYKMHLVDCSVFNY